jgi:hypothetical protein
MARSIFGLVVLTVALAAAPALGARAVVTDPAFVPDDTWLLVKVRNDLVFAQPPVIPDYAAHLFNDDKVYTPLPSTAQFWLPKERPMFVLEFQPSGTRGDFSKHDLTNEINAMADVVEIYNQGPHHSAGNSFDWFYYRAYKNGSQIGRRENPSRTFSVPEPASAALVACGVAMLVAARRRCSKLA